MPTTVKVDISQAIAGLRDFEKTQLPFALAKTLTGLAQDSQAAVRQNARKAFTLRNNWTEQGIRIKPASKNGGDDGHITALVFTDTANRSTGAKDYLGRQETGGERVPVAGRNHIAIPTKYLRFLAGQGSIPAEWRPRALLGAVAGRYTSFKRSGQIALKNQRGSKGFTFFLQTIKDGELAIMGRYQQNHDAVPMYLLIAEATIKKSALNMVETVQRVSNENFQARWDENWRNIRLRGIRI